MCEAAFLIVVFIEAHYNVSIKIVYSLALLSVRTQITKKKSKKRELRSRSGSGFFFFFEYGTCGILQLVVDSTAVAAAVVDTFDAVARFVKMII